MSMKATGTYVYRRTLGENNKEAYRISMQKCIMAAELHQGDFKSLKAILRKYKSYAEDLYPSKFLNSKKQERNSHDLAIAHAVEIVDSLESRFIEGSSDSELRIYRNIGYTYDATKIFED